jgi:hypothetical protein
MIKKRTYSFLSIRLTNHRCAAFFILLVLTVSLTSLGIRLPSLAGLSSNSGKPKPRPRAVINNQIKTCKQVVKSLADPVVFLPEKFFTVETPQAEQIPFLFPTPIYSCTFLPDSPSRSPPSPSSPA